MSESPKLYRVVLRGLGGRASSPDYQHSYVVARSMDDAYARVRGFLDLRDLGFRPQREVDRVELVAECALYPDCGTLLFLAPGGPDAD